MPERGVKRYSEQGSKGRQPVMLSGGNEATRMTENRAQDYVWHSQSPDQTLAWGRRLGRRLVAGDVVCLAGELGAGKTLLAQGIAQGLDVPGDVASPTFTLLQIYQGRVPVYHFDLYRLLWEEELEDIGFYAFTGGDGVALIEWPDKFPAALPPTYLWIQITRSEAATARRLRLQPQGDRYVKLCEEMTEIC